MVKKVLKLAVIASALVVGLGFGYTVAGNVTAALGNKVSEKVRQWVAAFSAVATAILAGVVATKLSSRFLGAGGPSLDAKVK